ALRRLAFDAAVILRFDHWWGAWLARLAGIPRVVGYDLPTTRPFLTQAVPYQPGRHEALQNLGLLQALLGRQAAELSPGAAPMEFAFPAAAAQAVAGRLGPAPYLCLHPGAGAAVKLWPADRWAQAADALSGEVGRVVLTGGPDELALAWQVAAHMRSEPLVLAGQTSLDELAAIFAQARLALGSDSGPLKLAQAVGAPTVQLYGPVDADAFGPWGDPAAWRVVRSPLPCVPCHRLDYAPDELPAHRCMEAIPVEAVVAAARELL
ncbi:MAG: glycosyltransferase family 9 protein, partial [Chloroflexi bacterium]|nr:glycosyltransferase family 9 protein [Chloroflexota bacterium]